MRNFYILVIPFLAVACDISWPGLEPRQEGESCTYGECDVGLRCDASETCVQCGGEGQICCAADSDDDPCDVGTLTCVDESEGFGTCETSGDDEPPSPPVVADECHDPTGQPYTVYYIDAECNQHDLSFQTQTPAKAEECSQQQAPNDVEICPLGVEPDQQKTCYSYLGGAGVPQEFWHCSDAWLQVCKNTVCTDCAWTDVEAEDACQ